MSDAEGLAGFIPVRLMDVHAAEDTELAEMFALPRDFEFAFKGKEVFSRIWLLDGMIELVDKSATFSVFGRGSSIREAIEDWEHRVTILQERYAKQGEVSPL